MQRSKKAVKYLLWAVLQGGGAEVVAVGILKLFGLGEAY